MDDVVQALIIAFSVIVFVLALSISMHMFSQVTTTAEDLALYSDSTRFYDNIQLDPEEVGESYTERLVSTETIIPTLYRYYKENFCVKIYDANSELIQIFDVNLENLVNKAAADKTALTEPTDKNDLKYIEKMKNYALGKIYNDKTKRNYYLFEAPWLGSTENLKTRIDFFVNGQAGYINNKYVDYTGNEFYNSRHVGDDTKEPEQYRERFISYSYDGQTLETEEGDTLVTGASEKDKIIIIYTMVDDTDEP